MSEMDIKTSDDSTLLSFKESKSLKDRLSRLISDTSLSEQLQALEKLEINEHLSEENDSISPQDRLNYYSFQEKVLSLARKYLISNFPSYHARIGRSKRTFLNRYGYFFLGLNLYSFMQNDFSRVVYDDKFLLTSIVNSLGYRIPEPKWLIATERAFDFKANAWKSTQEVMDDILDSKAFAKIRKGAGGRGAFFIDSGHVTMTDGTRLENPKEELLSLFLDSSKKYLLEEYIEQTDEVSIFNPSSLNTFRVVTYINQKGRAHVVGGFFRTGLGDHVVDNVAAGGLYCGLDIYKGCLLSPAMDEEGEAFTQHPISSVVFEGYPIPQWEEVVRMCTDCHEGIGMPNTVGWDVAISTEGPVVLEGNTMWTVDVFTKSNPRAAARLWCAHLDDWGDADIGFTRNAVSKKSLAGKRLKVVAKIEGKVQNVGFRSWLKRRARLMGLSGSVQNEDDGSVRFDLSGPIRKVEALLMLISKGPEASNVQSITLIKGQVSPGDDFESVKRPEKKRRRPRLLAGSVQSAPSIVDDSY